MTKAIQIFENEAEVLSQYLIGESCTAEIGNDFALAISKLEVELNEKQTTTYQSMLRSSFYLSAIDGGLAFTNPQSVLRKRIFVMLCLLEASKNYTDYFLPKERSWFYFFQIGFEVAYAFFTAIIGLIIIKLYNIE